MSRNCSTSIQIKIAKTNLNCLSTSSWIQLRFFTMFVKLFLPKKALKMGFYVNYSIESIQIETSHRLQTRANLSYNLCLPSPNNRPFWQLKILHFNFTASPLSTWKNVCGWQRSPCCFFWLPCFDYCAVFFLWKRSISITLSELIDSEIWLSSAWSGRQTITEA